MTKQTVTKILIEKEINLAETKLNFCWKVLEDLKYLNIDESFVDRFISFQDKLGKTIFDLQLIRKQIIKEEKHFIENKKKYKTNWFSLKMKNLSQYKKGIDNVINISKSIGDAFAYFFYKNEDELYAKHLNHQRINNSNADIGKVGELEFVKNIKHIEGHFTLFHDITNSLRYGDFSFINLKKLRVESIGELKTKRIDAENINLQLTLLNRNHYEKKIEKTKTVNKGNDRNNRQLVNIANFLTPEEKSQNDYNEKLFNKSYCKEINELLLNSKIKKANIKIVSDGLIFISIKSKSTSLFNNIFNKDLSKNSINTQNDSEFLDSLKKIIKPESENNGIIFDQLLYNSDFTNKDTPGTIPLFWQSIDIGQLKKLYFYNVIVISFFNPVHLIERLNDLGYFVDSKYSKIEKDVLIHKKGIESFDLFIPYIINFLMTEDFIINIITKIENEPSFHKNNMRLVIKLNQKIE